MDATPTPPVNDFSTHDLPTHGRRLPRLLWILVVLCLALVLPRLAGEIQYSITRGQLRARADDAAEQIARLGKQAELVSLADTSKAFRLVARRIEPSVVHIDTVQEMERNGADEWAFQFPRGRERLEGRGQGSGVIVDAQAGYILTNFHVVRGATRVQVHLSDGRTIDNDDIEIIGFDEATDLAVLRVGAGELTAAIWGSSKELEVGDWVLAVGNPYGLDRTVTLGIVSATQRRGIGGGYQKFLQTDAAVNPGNSGGPLLNIRGELVGITTAIVGEAYQGISFAIPSELAQNIYERLKQSGHVARGWLGVQPQQLSQDVAERLNLKGHAGFFVAAVLRGSPADAAGVQSGDLIIEFNGQKVSDNSELPLLVADAPIGENVKMTVLRGGQPLELTVKIGQRPDRLAPK